MKGEVDELMQSEHDSKARSADEPHASPPMPGGKALLRLLDIVQRISSLLSSLLEEIAQIRHVLTSRDLDYRSL